MPLSTLGTAAMGHTHRILHFVILTILSLSPLPREWALPTTDMLVGLWDGLSLHPADRTTTHAG